MSGEKRDFYGKEIADAIREACTALRVPQERLAIEVVETGSTGIFGLIRKKAHIRARVKSGSEELEAQVFAVSTLLADSARGATEEEEEGDPEDASEVEAVIDVSESGAAVDVSESDVVLEVSESEVAADVSESEVALDEEEDDEAPVDDEAGAEVSPEGLAIVREELARLVTLMGMPMELSIAADGLNVVCTLRGPFEEELIGTDGKVLDSLQYLLRKIVSRRVSQRLKISVNVGDFREKRLDELKTRAKAMAEQVKENGKTQILPALNPSERRAVHMVLQEDKDIRSRSVGDGLFKKILIYKPGSRGNSRPSGRRRSGGKGKKVEQENKEGGEA